MGYRTVVVLNNDLAHEWSKDPQLGERIQREIQFGQSDAQRPVGGLNQFGTVAECTHADVQSLMIVDSLRATTVARGWFQSGETTVQVCEKLLRELAAHCGYNLVKKPNPSAR